MLSHSRSSAIVLMLASTALVVGCASTPSKRDCEQTDAYQMGLEDGEKGRTTQNFEKMSAACNGQGVALAKDKYDFGRKVGLAKYCDESQAKSDARDGKTDSICMAEAVPPYQNAYRAEMAKREKAKQEELAKIQKEQAALKKKQDQAQSDLNQIQGQNGATQKK